jgi:succinyl-CoA synthetase alpha subunit
MGHAGAIVSGGDDTAEAKMRILKESGIGVAESVADIGDLMKTAMENK